MIIKANPEFGVELALVVPYAYWLHLQGELEMVVTSKGMRPFYYFCDNVEEYFKERTIDNAAAGLNELPNNWIHGIDSENKPAVLDYEKWICPPYKEIYKQEYTGKPRVFVTNKYNIEHGQPPKGFFDIQCLYEMFEILHDKGYEVIYKRATNKEDQWTTDQNEKQSIGLKGITAYVKDLGQIDDFYLVNQLEGVHLYNHLYDDLDDNLGQLKVMATCDKFISVSGGNAILSSLFGGDLICYVHKGKELRPNYFGEESYFRKLSGTNIIPIFDVIGSVNSKTYNHKVNTTGTNDYRELLETIKDRF